jgi:hypothetical protein
LCFICCFSIQIGSEKEYHMKLTLRLFLGLSLLAGAVGGTTSYVYADSGCCSSCGSSSCNGCCKSDCNDCCSTGSNVGCCDNVSCKPRFLPFSQGENRARDYAEVLQFSYLPDQEDWNWNASLALEYQQNFDRCRLGSYFFPNGNTLTVGADSTLGGTVDVRNVDLGLSSTFAGTLTINPKISNIIIEPAFYVGLDRWVEGMYIWTKIPIVNSRWDLKCCSKVTQTGSPQFIPFYQVGTCIPNRPYESMSSTSLTSTCPAGSNTNVGADSVPKAFDGSATWGDHKTGLKCLRIICCDDNKTGVADIPLHWGYNFINKDKGFLGAYLRVVFPTGNEDKRNSIFDARVGYKRWQLGAGINGRVRLYERDEESAANFVADFQIGHIFSKSECRPVDLINGCFSRYLLMKEADANGNYTGNLVNAVDVLSVKVKSRFDWILDGLFYFNFRHKAWNWDLGYEIKARACEKFDCDCLALCNCCTPCDEDDCCDSACSTPADPLGGKQYGIKGCLALDGVGNPVTTASKSTIKTCAGADTTAVLINNKNFANYVDINSARIPKALSNKIFTNFGRTWAERDYPISAGLGAEVEFGNDNKALRLWGIWAKAAVAYN